MCKVSLHGGRERRRFDFSFRFITRLFIGAPPRPQNIISSSPHGSLNAEH